MSQWAYDLLAPSGNVLISLYDNVVWDGVTFNGHWSWITLRTTTPARLTGSTCGSGYGTDPLDDAVRRSESLWLWTASLLCSPQPCSSEAAYSGVEFGGLRCVELTRPSLPPRRGHAQCRTFPLDLAGTRSGIRLSRPTRAHRTAPGYALICRVVLGDLEGVVSDLDFEAEFAAEGLDIAAQGIDLGLVDVPAFERGRPGSD